MKTTIKKRVGILGLVFALCLSMMTTFSFFTDRETRHTMATAGSLDLVFTDISASKSGTNGITSQNTQAIDRVWENKSLVSEGSVIDPGDIFDLSYTLTNKGSKSMDVKQQLVLGSTVAMTEGSEAYTLSIRYKDGTEQVVNGVLSDDGLTITYDLPVITLNGSIEKENGVSITEQTYIVQLTFALTAGNTFQDSVVTVNYKAQAKQHRNTTDEHWADWLNFETEYEEVGKGEDDSDEPEITSAAGLYEPGTNYTVLKTSWADLVDAGDVTVSSTGAVSGSEELAGDLLLPTDGSVTSIKASGFEAGESLTGIFIPASVTSIGNDAFIECTGLKNVTFAANSQITKIKSDAFAYCSALESINIPDSVTSIGNNAFSECTSLASVTFGRDSQLTEIDYGVFSLCTSLTSIGPVGSGADFMMPDSVTSIGKYAFTECTGLTSIKIPDTVTTLDEYAFANCSGLTSIGPVGSNADVIIPDSVTSIGKASFGACTGLESIELPSSVTYIYTSTFANCTNLKNVTIPSSVTGISLSAFDGCENLTTVTFGEDSQLTAIGQYSFRSCSGLTSIIIPEGVTSIANSAFYECTGLQSIELPSSVTSIRDSAFFSCTALKNVYYAGTEEQWNAISIGENNSYLTRATITYNYTKAAAQ